MDWWCDGRRLRRHVRRIGKQGRFGGKLVRIECDQLRVERRRQDGGQSLHVVVERVEVGLRPLENRAQVEMQIAKDFGSGDLRPGGTAIWAIARIVARTDAGMVERGLHLVGQRQQALPRFENGLPDIPPRVLEDLAALPPGRCPDVVLQCTQTVHLRPQGVAPVAIGLDERRDARAGIGRIGGRP
jgi:hypothetical protein